MNGNMLYFHKSLKLQNKVKGIYVVKPLSKHLISMQFVFASLIVPDICFYVCTYLRTFRKHFW